MTPLQVDKNNEKIAKFLGWFRQYKDRPTWFVRQEFGIYVACSSTRDMKFHESLDALIPVIRKIGELEPSSRVTHMYSVEINGNGTTIYKSLYTGSDNIITRNNSRDNWAWNTWLCCVEFIDWYNKKQGYGETVQEES